MKRYEPTIEGHYEEVCDRLAEYEGGEVVTRSDYDALKAQLAALSPTWSEAKPTVPGWWWRKYESFGKEIIEVVRVLKSGSALVIDNYGGTIDGTIGSWAGPLPAPREATK